MGVCHCNEKQTELGSIEFENPIITQRQEKSNTSFYQKPTSNSPLCQTQAVFRGYLTRSLFKKKVEVETMQEIQITFNYEELNEVPNFLSHKATQTLRNISEFVYTDKAIGVISRGPVKLPDHSIYIGEWNRNGEPSGRGEKYFSDGSYTKGMWKQGKMHGKCLQIFSNGDYYVGDIFDDTIQGSGKLFTQESQCTYEGTWKDGKQEGFGVETWPDGARFSGQFINGKKTGKGKFIWADNSVYEGEFVENQICGSGKYKWADEREYNGQWKNNMMHGKGIFVWADGRKYEGDYVDDKKEGFGVFTWPNQKSYSGEWKNGRQNGIGEIKSPNKKNKKGEWKDGKRIRWIDN